MKTVFVEGGAVDLTAAEVLRQVGMPPDHAFAGKIDELIANVAPMAKPKAFYMEYKVEKTTKYTVTLGGKTFVCPSLAANLKEGDTVYPFLCTCGRELEDYAATLEDIMEQYALDVIMELYRKDVAMRLSKAVDEELDDESAAMYPGAQKDWHIRELFKLFEIIGENAENVGVTLSESCVMEPMKTAMGIRFLPADFGPDNHLCQGKICTTIKEI